VKTKTCRVLIWILVAIALGCGVGLPRLLLASWSPLARSAVSVGGQVFAYAAMAALALWMEPTLAGLPSGTNEPAPRP
jgi:hypothetical protein